MPILRRLISSRAGWLWVPVLHCAKRFGCALAAAFWLFFSVAGWVRAEPVEVTVVLRIKGAAVLHDEIKAEGRREHEG